MHLPARLAQPGLARISELQVVALRATWRESAFPVRLRSALAPKHCQVPAGGRFETVEGFRPDRFLERTLLRPGDTSIDLREKMVDHRINLFGHK